MTGYDITHHAALWYANEEGLYDRVREMIAETTDHASAADALQDWHRDLWECAITDGPHDPDQHPWIMPAEIGDGSAVEWRTVTDACADECDQCATSLYTDNRNPDHDRRCTDCAPVCETCGTSITNDCGTGASHCHDCDGPCPACYDDPPPA